MYAKRRGARENRDRGTTRRPRTPSHLFVHCSNSKKENATWLHDENTCFLSTACTKNRILDEHDKGFVKNLTFEGLSAVIPDIILRMLKNDALVGVCITDMLVLQLEQRIFFVHIFYGGTQAKSK